MSEQAATEPVEGPASNGQPPGVEGWERDGRGRLYVKRPGAPGVVFRRDEETVAEALARDASPDKDKRPRRKAKSKRPPMPEAPSGVDLKALEKMLAEALTAPAMACAMVGDEWSANHFTTQGPYLARNLVLASEHNPWLRRKLEEMATGQDAATKLIAMLGVAGALVGYAVPPIIYFLNLPVPEQARQMFGIPPARQPQPNAPGPAPPAEPVAA
jgi:hypothetical protein